MSDPATPSPPSAGSNKPADKSKPKAKEAAIYRPDGKGGLKREKLG